MNASEIDGWAQQHHGLISWTTSGLSNDAWHRALRSGRLVAVHRHVARLPGAPPTAAQRIAAAVMAAGPQAVASHRSAAWLWKLVDDPGQFCHVISRQSRSRRNLNGVIVHRPRDRQRLVPQRRLGIACTDPLRTLLDLGAGDSDLVSPAVGEALSAGLVTLDALSAALEQHARPGRTGVVALRQAIIDWSIDHLPADSTLEIMFTKLVQRYRLPPVTFHESIEGWEVDFRFVGTAVIVECDGWSTHGLDRDQFERDRRRDLDLGAAGWFVLRLSYRAIVHDSAATAQRIRQALDQWRHLRAPDAA